MEKNGNAQRFGRFRWQKWERAMRLCFILLFAFSFGLSAKTKAQEERVSLHLENVELKTVLEKIQEQAHINFMVNREQTAQLGLVSVNVKDETVVNILDHLLDASQLTYVFIDNVIVIKERQQQEQKKALKISGIVLDEKQKALPGTTVRLSGTSFGVVTNAEGRFEITVPVTEGNLEFSFVGFETRTIPFTEKTEPLRVLLKEEITEMEEVVITGYQNIDRRKNTSAVTSVKTEDIVLPSVTSIDKMLEGRIPDLMLMTNSGEVGVVPKLRIRGTSTLIGNREPIWVVDGIIVQDPVNIAPEELNDPDYINRIGNAIAGLNPQDIERLDILKDAAATAIYGTKAANGVIVITTKKGRVGRPVVQYNMTTTMRQRPRYTDRKIDLMNSQERIRFSKELFDAHYEYPEDVTLVGYEKLMNQLYAGAIGVSEFNQELAKMETMNTDWFKLLTKDSWSHQHTLSVSGGSETARYYGSIGYTRDNDVIKGNRNERYTAALNLDVNMTRWLTASFNMNGNVSTRDYYPEEIAPMNYAYKTTRVLPAFDENGQYYFYKRMVDGTKTEYNYNILNELENSSYKQEGSGLTVNANLQFKFTDWLNANAIVSYQTSNTVIDQYYGENTYYAATLRGTEYGVVPEPYKVVMDDYYGEIETGGESLMPFGGELKRQDSRNNSYTVRLQLNANKFWGRDNQHNIFASAGYEMSSTKYKQYDNTTRGYYPDRGMSFAKNVNLEDYPAYGNWLASNVPVLKDDLNNTISGYISASYSFRGWFTLNGNARVDGSNRFGDQTNNRFLPIWSASANWNLGEINWLRERNWIDFITLKTSYGYQGNMLSDQSPVMIIEKHPMDTYYGELATTLKRNANPDLKWEKTSSYNLGLDFSLFQRKLMMEVAYYFKHTKDAFMTKQIASMNGIDGNSYVINRGDVDNSGYSFAITVSPVNTRDFRWTLSTSFSRTINKVKSAPDSEAYELEDFLDGEAIVKGKAVGTFYSYRFLGLSPVDGGPMFDDYGDRRLELYGLNKYDTYTRVLEASGRREPFMSGGLNTTLRYKNFRLSGSFSYSLGGKIRLFGMYSKANDDSFNASQIRPTQNMSRDFLNRWKYPGDEKHTTIPAILSDSHPSSEIYRSHWSSYGEHTQVLATNYWEMYDYANHRVVSSNYLKCQNISLTYQFNERLIKKAGMSRLELTLSGGNLFTIASRKLKGQTPTQSGFAAIQLSDRPTYSIGLNVSF